MFVKASDQGIENDMSCPFVGPYQGVTEPEDQAAGGIDHDADDNITITRKPSVTYTGQ